MKKRIGLITLLMGLVMIVGGCANNAQSQFADYMGQQNDSKFNAGTVKVSIADLELDELASNGAKNPMTGMVMAQLKNIKFSTDYQLDAKNPKLAKIDAKIDLMGMVIPFDMITKTDKNPQVLMSTSFLTSIGEIAEAFGGGAVGELPDFSEFAGKYIDVMALQENGTDKNEVPKVDKSQLENAEAYTAAYRKEMATYLKSLDKKTFIKKDETLTHKFTKKELTEMMELSQKVAKSDKKFKEYQTEEDIFADVFKTVKDMSLTVQVNPKKNNYKTTLSIKPATELKAGFKSITLKIEGDSKANKERVEMPSKDDIVSKEALEAFTQSQVVSPQLDDAQFQDMKASLVAGKESISKEDLADALKLYKGLLTAEQYQELEAALK